MTNSNTYSFNCSKCPFEGQDCVYCRTCKHCDHEKHAHNRKKSPAPIRRWLRRQSNYYRVSFGYGWGVWVERWFVGRAPCRLDTKPTHNISAAGVGCVGGNRRLPANPKPSNGSRPSPFAPSRRTRLTLKKTTVRGYRSQFNYLNSRIMKTLSKEQQDTTSTMHDPCVTCTFENTDCVYCRLCPFYH